MALFFADLVRETSWAGGAGPLKLEGAVPGHRRFAGTVPEGVPFHYCVAGVTHPSEWETGEGTLSADGSLERSPLASSAGGAAVAFSPGLKTVALTAGAAWFASRDALQMSDVAGLSAALGGKQAAGEYAPAAHSHPYLPLAGGTVAGEVVADSLGIGGSPAAAKLEVRGLHADTKLRLFSAGLPGVDATASLDLYASLPGMEFGGSGIGSNLNGHPTAGARDAASASAALQFRESGDIHLRSGAAGQALADRLVIEIQGTRPGGDNLHALGAAANRWSALYAASGTISTSDENAKQDVVALPEEWLDAWEGVDWLGFRFRDAVEAKGAAARQHVGLVAQRVEAAFAAHGIDARAIGLLCVDEVAEGEERFGLRYDECFAMEAAAQRRRMSRIEARLAMLEATAGAAA